ncbi:MAG TPA: hypothetical protein VLQ79_01365 [Myxococcaceae bacterium]|nr:hypothetical protein [Myxococcaceae bacterium]
MTACDVSRLRAATGLRHERFVEDEPLSPGEAVEYEARRPGYRGYFRATAVRFGLRAEHGACVFLDAQGCTLDVATRPTACLLYPFEPAEHGWTLAVERSGSAELAASSGEPRCLAAEEARGRGALLRSFGIDAEGLTALIDRLRAEVAAHPEALDSVKRRAPRTVAGAAEPDRPARLRRSRLR